MPTGDRPQSSLADPSRRARLGSVALGLGTAVALAAGAILAWSVVSTASARISGATDNPDSLLQAAVIELTTGDGGDGGDGGGGSRSEFDLDAEGLYPGLPVERCLQLRYQGTLEEIDVVLSARVRGGTGLDRYLDTEITVGEGTDPACGDFTAGEERYRGSLAELASAHPRYERGLVLVRTGAEAPVTVRFRIEVRSDNAAQRRTTDVGLTFEVRP